MNFDIWQPHPTLTPAVAELTWPTLHVEFMRHPHRGVAVEAQCTRCRTCFRSSDGHGGEGPVCYLSEEMIALIIVPELPEAVEESQHRERVTAMAAAMIASRVNRVPCACAVEHQAKPRATTEQP